MEYIYFSLFAISVNLLGQLVIIIYDPSLKNCALSENGLMLIIIFCST